MVTKGMSAIGKTVQQALQLGIKEVLEPHFDCRPVEDSSHSHAETGEWMSKTVGTRCEWPKNLTPAGFGRLRYDFFISIQSSPEGGTQLQWRSSLMWEGRIERWANWRFAVGYDIDLDGQLDEIQIRSKPTVPLKLQRENGEWFCYPTREKATPFQLQEIILPTQESYTQSLVLGGLLLIHP